MRIVNEQRVALVGLKALLQLAGDCMLRVELKDPLLLRTHVGTLGLPKHPFEGGAHVAVSADQADRRCCEPGRQPHFLNRFVQRLLQKFQKAPEMLTLFT